MSTSLYCYWFASTLSRINRNQKNLLQRRKARKEKNIDHAGALARLLDHYPMAKAVCHADAIKHLINPGRLWAGSRNIAAFHKMDPDVQERERFFMTNGVRGFVEYFNEK